jgi:hypothetical protein
MALLPSDSEKVKLYRILPWLHFWGALLVVVFNALFSAVHSPLGQEISAGESPGFAWIRANITLCMGLVLAYLILVCWIQLRQNRRSSSFVDNRLLPVLVCLQVIGDTVLLMVILIQSIIASRRPGILDFDHQPVMPPKPAVNAKLFFILLFIMGAAIAFLDPSWHRLSDQIVLDTNFESRLRYAFPPILSGITGIWLGIGMLIIIIGIHRLFFKLYENKDFWMIYFSIFFCLVVFFTGFLLITLYYAISWQINNLHLKLAVWQLFIFLSVSGGILFSSVFFRIRPHIPRPQQCSMIDIVSLTFGATIIYPIAWLLTFRRNTKTGWVLLLISTLGAVCC